MEFHLDRPYSHVVLEWIARMAAFSVYLWCKHQVEECSPSDAWLLPSQSIIQVILVCCAGYLLTLRGILDKTTQRVCLRLSSLIFFLHCFQQLNALNVNFFTPCLLFSKVAFSLSAGMGMPALILPTRHLSLIDEFRELWIIPLFFILISGVSLVVAWLLALVFRLNRPQKCV